MVTIINSVQSICEWKLKTDNECIQEEKPIVLALIEFEDQVHAPH